MKYTEVKRLEELRRSLGCYQDENGNWPCDNGAVCDRCMAAQAETYHQDIADLTEAAHTEEKKWCRLYTGYEVKDSAGILKKLADWGFEEAETTGHNIAVRATDSEIESIRDQMPDELLAGNRVLTYDEFQALAMAYYNEGGDPVVECWGKSEFEFHEQEWGPMTVTEALKLFKRYKSMECER